MSHEQWQDRHAKCFGMLLDGRAQPTGIRRRGSDATLLLVMNAYHDVVTFTLPKAPEGKCWVCLFDTNAPDRTDAPTFEFEQPYEVTGRSLLVFVLDLNGQRRNLRDGIAAILDIAETPVASDLLCRGAV